MKNKRKLETHCLSNNTFPVAAKLTMTDPGGYEDDQRWMMFGEKCYGYTGEEYFGATPREVLSNFNDGEKRP